MNREEVLQLLTIAKPELARRYGVVRLALFGSVARDKPCPDSDMDIVVPFDGPATSQRYFDVQFYLEDALGRPVDLVTDKALRAPREVGDHVLLLFRRPRFPPRTENRLVCAWRFTWSQMFPTDSVEEPNIV